MALMKNQHMKDKDLLLQRGIVESYLRANGFEDVHSVDGVDVSFTMRRGAREYQIHVERPWLGLKTDMTIQERLDALQVISFLRINYSAQLSITEAGCEALTRMAGSGSGMGSGGESGNG